jgi:hypothetical protein
MIILNVIIDIHTTLHSVIKFLTCNLLTSCFFGGRRRHLITPISQDDSTLIVRKEAIILRIDKGTLIVRKEAITFLRDRMRILSVTILNVIIIVYATTQHPHHTTSNAVVKF